jgi:hypothetical protein
MARDVSRMWGGDPVQPLPEAYDALAGAIESDILTDGIRYINPPKKQNDMPAKREKIDLSRSRQGWVDGCSAAVHRCDTVRSSGSYNPRHGRGWGPADTRAQGGSRGKFLWKSGGRSWRGNQLYLILLTIVCRV